MTSRIFPNLPITEVLPECLNRSKNFAMNATMKAFRALVRELK